LDCTAAKCVNTAGNFAVRDGKLFCLTPLNKLLLDIVIVRRRRREKESQNAQDTEQS